MNRVGEGVAGSCGLGFGGLAGGVELGSEGESLGGFQDPLSSRESLTPAFTLPLQPRPLGLVQSGVLTRKLLMS